MRRFFEHHLHVWCVTAAALALAACAPTANREAAGNYRTITVDPRRDTEAAARANAEGLLHLEKGDLAQAEAAFARALSADVEFGPAHNNLGKVYFLKKDWYKAAWEFEYAAKLMPRRAEPRNNLGLVLEQAGELDRAVDSYREAVKLEANLEYQGNLARALIRRGDRTEEVRQLLREVMARDSRSEWRDWAQRELSR